jgi:hypothetical protein
MFGKWKKRAYEQLERAEKAEAELTKISEELKSVIEFGKTNPTIKSILDQKMVIEKNGKRPRRIYISGRSYNALLEHLTSNGIDRTISLDTLFGMKVAISPNHDKCIEVE